MMAGDPEQALVAIESAGDDSWFEMLAIMALHDLRQSQEFDTRFSEFRSDAGNAVLVAHIYAWVGDSDKAFEWIDRIPKADRKRFIGTIDADIFAEIMCDDRWQTMQAKYGLTDDASNEAIKFTYTLPAGAANHDRRE